MNRSASYFGSRVYTRTSFYTLRAGACGVARDKNLSRILTILDGKQRISTDSDGQEEPNDKGSESVFLSHDHRFSTENATERYRARTCDPLIKSQLLYQLS